MPIYAYRCDSCGVRKDVLQKISEAPLAECPECGASSFHKELTAPAFQLKGSGWYATDFRDNGKPKEKAADTPAEATASGEAASAAPAKADSGKAGEAAASTSGKSDAASTGKPKAGTASTATPAA
jgi:putative FmdB family regulatory protein